jgi:hypothetical protein
MAFDSGNVITISSGVMSVDLAAINTFLTGTDLDISTSTTKKGAAIKAFLDYLVASASSTTYDSDNTFPITASDGEFGTTPTYQARGANAYQYKTYSIKAFSGTIAPTINFDPDDMAA